MTTLVEGPRTTSPSTISPSGRVIDESPRSGVPRRLDKHEPGVAGAVVEPAEVVDEEKPSVLGGSVSLETDRVGVAQPKALHRCDVDPSDRAAIAPTATTLPNAARWRARSLSRRWWSDIRFRPTDAHHLTATGPGLPQAAPRPDKILANCEETAPPTRLRGGSGLGRRCRLRDNSADGAGVHRRVAIRRGGQP